MPKEDTDNSKLMAFLDNGIIISIFLFALASLTSKGLSSIGLGLACLLWLIRIIVTKDYQFKKTDLDRTILLFVASLFISGLDNWGLQFLDSVDKFILAILFYYVIVNTITELETVKKLSYVALFSMLVASGLGLYQHFYLDVNRAHGFMLSLAFGGLLAMFLLFMISYLLWGNLNWKLNVSSLLIIVIMALNLLFTKSRGAWLGFIGGIVSLIWIQDKKLIIGLVICLLVGTLFLPHDFINRFKSSFVVDINVSNWNDLDRNMRSNLTRVALWKSTIEMWQDNFINGVGIGRFKEANRKGDYASEYNGIGFQKYSHAHNNFLHFLATTGTIGFLAFSWLMFKILKLLYEWYRRIDNKQWKLFILASLGSFIVFNIQGLTEFSFGDTEPLRFFWFLIAINMIIINDFSSNQDDLSKDIRKEDIKKI
ncbi:O-antigen ligase family protein [Halanaerocella petrolearia]